MRAPIIVLGFLLGILVGVSLLLVNPLAFVAGMPPLATGVAPLKAYRWADYRGMEGGVADLLGLGRPDRKVALKAPALAHVRIGIVVLPAGEGTPAALAVKVAAIAGENALWKARLGTHDTWSILWPGEGSVFAASYSNFWAVARDTFFATARGGGRDLMAPEYGVSAPSAADDPTGVTGASGRYAGFTGEIRDVYSPGDPDPDWALAIRMNPPPVGAR
ncbi:MAG: hypothetical protein ABI661_01200 [Gammaproteobacteria bacterium]